MSFLPFSGLCFALKSATSNTQSFNQWIPELQHYAPGIPVVLVGTKLGTLNGIDNFSFGKLKIDIDIHLEVEFFIVCS